MSDRPYRVYRGGKRGPEPDPDASFVLEPEVRPEADRRGPLILPADPRSPPAAAPRPPRRRRWRPRRIALALLLVGTLVIGGWLVIGYLAFASSMEAANRRLAELTRAHPVADVLDRQAGLLVSQPTTILVLGRDRTGRSDSIQLIRLDPAKHLVASLAVPRDLRVAIDGHGNDRINAAFAFGGTALAIRTVRSFTGLEINHVVLVDFRGFVRLIDAVGGVDVVSPKRLRSEFDGKRYTFPRGRVHLSGRRALAYARIRKNALDSTDSDVTRGQRQQQVMQALKRALSSPATLLDLRVVGARAADPLATDLTAAQLLQLGWVDFRADRHLQCHLGGTPTDIAGASYLQSVPENRRVLAEFRGETAPLPGDRSDPFAPACT